MASNKLKEEADRCSFDAVKLSEILYGEQNAKLRKQILQDLEFNHPLLKVSLSEYELEMKDLRELSLKRLIYLHTFLENKSEVEKTIYLEYVSAMDRSLSMRQFVHTPLFTGQLLHSGTEEQINKWVTKANKLEIIGCFGMTELGHSSHLQGIETTATFDVDSDEFIINSPTETSTKVWIGLSSQTATHIIMFAKMIINQVDYGIQLFLVPLRDPKTGRLLEGRIVGDMGKKYGRNGLDNGWVRLQQVRVSRENMLMRWTKVDRNGQVELPSKLASAIAYGQTVMERVNSGKSAIITALSALIIATNYTALRNQSPIPNSVILDFKGVQASLIPHVATLFASHFAVEKLVSGFLEAQEFLYSGNEFAFLSGLPERHAQSCGFKAFLTWWATDVLEQARRALGGHGYSYFSGMPALIADFGVVTTGGGDNIVIAQQLSKFLIKQWESKITNSNNSFNSPSVDYLKEENPQIVFPSNIDEFRMHELVSAFSFLAYRQIELTFNKLAKTSSSNDPLNAKSTGWNEHMVDLLECARFHTWRTVAYHFNETIESLPASSPERDVLTDLFYLFAFSFISNYFGFFISFANSLDRNIFFAIRDRISVLNEKVRGNVIGLLNSLLYPDFILNSAFVQSKGNIYSTYLNALENSTQTSPVSPHWHLLSPFTASSSKL